MAYSPTLIANNVLARAFAERRYITPMKLQKILYFVASEYQKLTGQVLLEESFAMWAYGPVLYSVFNEFRTYSKDPIKRYARDAQGNAYSIDEASDLNLRRALDVVWKVTRSRGAIELSEITHREDSAWDKAYQSDSPFLDPEDIALDFTYYQPLGLAPGA